MDKKRVVFITGTRADFSKIKTLIRKIEESHQFDCNIFVTGMHMMTRYGSTYVEVESQGYKNIFKYINQTEETRMDVALANTIIGFSSYVHELKPDLIIVHGDRLEALAGAIVGSFNNIMVAHIEGGEVSGTIDESIRHSISKLAHLHFVANEESKNRLRQMGERDDHVFIIGSPDVDVMKSDNLPDIMKVKEHYEISFRDYAIFIYHPVTSEVHELERNITKVIDALRESEKNYVVIYPNNDVGSHYILGEFKQMEHDPHFRILPSMRFEYFLTLLKNSKFIIGNSSTGVREAEVYAIPCINLGSRQKNRSKSNTIINVKEDKKEILEAISKVKDMKLIPMNNFGQGDSCEKFYRIISQKKIFDIPIQKQFVDRD